MSFVESSLAKVAGARSTARFDVRVVYERKIDVAAERDRLNKELAKLSGELGAGQRTVVERRVSCQGSAASRGWIEEAQRRSRSSGGKSQGGAARARLLGPRYSRGCKSGEYRWIGQAAGLPHFWKTRCRKTAPPVTQPARPASIRQQRASATIIAKQDCVLSGLGCIQRILEIYAQLDGKVTSHPDVRSSPEIFDGVRLRKGQSVAVIRHNARVILACERLILNIMQRMSGIATATRHYVDAVAGTKATILDTRKTAPGLRLLDKWAVRCGGGTNHRLDLSDGILIKNNHIALAGGAVQALETALSQTSQRACRSKSKCARWKNSSRRCNMAPKPSCSTT